MKNNLVYVAMCGDIIHNGHINILKEAQKYGTVVVGLLTDTAIRSYKKNSLMNYDQRKIIVENIIGVSEVIPQETLDYTQNLLKIKPKYVVHGDDWRQGIQQQTRQKVIEILSKWNGQLIEIPYTKNVSSTIIKNKINHKKILFCFGTRPEWLKIKPLIEKIQEHKILFTSQHNDTISSILTDYTLKIPLQKHNTRLNQIISSCIDQFPVDNNCEYVLVQGDTASSFGCALAAFNNNQKIIYLESGLRTFDLYNPYPEEGYRQMISRIADIHFCPTELSKKNLLKENVAENSIYVVGNTSLDNIITYKDKCYYGDKVLITLHRRENLPILKDWISRINQCVEESCETNEYIWPLHPNPEIQKLKDFIHRKIKIVNPLDHEEMINLMIGCKFIITDSGGLQEEGCFLNKKIIVCRKNTERPEGIETGHLFICEDPTKLLDLFGQIDRSPWIKTYQNYCPYGDGHSSEKIAEIINKLY